MKLKQVSTRKPTKMLMSNASWLTCKIYQMAKVVQFLSDKGQHLMTAEVEEDHSIQEHNSHDLSSVINEWWKMDRWEFNFFPTNKLLCNIISYKWNGVENNNNWIYLKRMSIVVGAFEVKIFLEYRHLIIAWYFLSIPLISLAVWAIYLWNYHRNVFPLLNQSEHTLTPRACAF